MSDTEYKNRINWLINIRWIAVIFVLTAILLSCFVFRIQLPVVSLLVGFGILLSVNVLYYLYLNKFDDRLNPANRSQRYGYLTNIQIYSDLFMLLYFVHYTGGIENPLIFYAIFHTVITSIFLSKTAAYYQATVIVLLLGMLVFAEQTGILTHYHPAGFLMSDHCLLSLSYVVWFMFVFISTIYLTVYISSSIIDKLRERDLKFAEANVKLSEQDRLKSQYVLNVSHDLQSSLSAIQSCLKVVLDNLAGDISPKSREMINRAERRTRYLLEFVKDLLNLSRIRAADKIPKVQLSLRALIQSVVDRLNLESSEKHLALEIVESEDDDKIMANAESIEQLFTNIIGNAIKYTPWQGKITIRIDKIPKNKSLRISVEDTGIGIPAPELPYILNDFYRAKNAEELEQEGTGLGLSIAKSITEHHQGKLWVESKVGVGSTFILTFPTI